MRIFIVKYQKYCYSHEAINNLWITITQIPPHNAWRSACSPGATDAISASKSILYELWPQRSFSCRLRFMERWPSKAVQARHRRLRTSSEIFPQTESMACWQSHRDTFQTGRQRLWREVQPECRSRRRYTGYALESKSQKEIMGGDLGQGHTEKIPRSYRRWVRGVHKSTEKTKTYSENIEESRII